MKHTTLVIILVLLFTVVVVSGELYLAHYRLHGAARAGHSVNPTPHTTPATSDQPQFIPIYHRGGMDFEPIDFDL